MKLSSIQILPDIIANKIAAGEVVQRPESVVKELLENSIDASATNIELVIKRAGKLLIQVIDDGIGMSEEDAQNCIKRHATSKIKSIEDLDTLGTLGFRGEALSSISSVALLEIKTSKIGEELGTFIRVEDEEISIEKGSFAKGTSIAVKNLFYNTPARRKFLKAHATELKHIIETFKKTALSAPDISFKFWNDDDLLYNLSKGNYKERVQQIIADNITDVVLEVKEVTDYISLRGYIAKPTFMKNSKSYQYLFVNGRSVVSKQINHAVFSAYESLLEKGNYPFFVLFLELDQSKIDINVHPQKLEIKFDNDKEIYSYVNAVIRKTLGSYDLVPSYSLNNKLENNSDVGLKLETNCEPKKNDFSDRKYYDNKDKSSKSANFDENDIDLLFSSINSEIKNIIPSENQLHPFSDHEEENNTNQHSYESSEASNSSFIVSLHNKYILSQIRSGLMLIDQHVAHERILYEAAIKSMNTNIPFSQQLLFAQTVKVDATEFELLKQLKDHLTKLGFELNFYSDNTIVIDGVPDTVKVGLEAETLKDILFEYVKNNKEKGLEAVDNLAKSYACKTAIKAGDSLNEKEMRVLVDQLFATSNPYVCPHGRPIVIKIPILEFDKKFGRV